MKKEALVLVLCGVLSGCGAVSPAASTSTESPTPSTASTSPQAAAQSPIRKDLDASRIKISTELDVDARWRLLTTQGEVAKKYRTRKNTCEALKANGSSECGENPECTTQIVPSCDRCLGGPSVCVPRGTMDERVALVTEQNMVQCLAQSDTTWQIFSRPKSTTPKTIYNSCLCDRSPTSAASYAKQGWMNPDFKAGRCLTQRERCSQQGGKFMEARLVETITPALYDSHGLTVRLNELGKRCSLQMQTAKKAKDDVLQAFVNAEGACVVQRFKGYPMTISNPSKDKDITFYAAHSCIMP